MRKKGQEILFRRGAKRKKKERKKSKKKYIISSGIRNVTCTLHPDCLRATCRAERTGIHPGWGRILPANATRAEGLEPGRIELTNNKAGASQPSYRPFPLNSIQTVRGFAIIVGHFHCGRRTVRPTPIDLPVIHPRLSAWFKYLGFAIIASY